MKVFKVTMILAILAAMPAFSQDAAEIMDKAAKAVGGQAALNIKSMVSSATISMPGGIKGKLLLSYKSEDKIHVKTTINAPGINIEAMQGCDGKDCYSKDPNFGLRLLEGQEKEMMLTQNDFKNIVEWRSYYTKAEYKGESDVNGKKAYMIYLETKEGMVMTNYVDAETYLTLKSEVKTESPMGKMDVVMNYHDYKDVHEGFMMPMKTTMTMMGQEMKTEYDSFEVNIPVPDSRFALPEGLKQ